MIREEVARRRQEYESAGLDPDEMADDPFSEFEQWFAGAVAVELYEPSAFVLATASSDATPSARAVLMKDFSVDGLVFYTNLSSRKSQELLENPKAAATFLWAPLHRQVRFEGDVEQVPDAVADAYFSTRPRGAQLAAHASRQSQVVPDRIELESRFEALESRFEDEVPRPDDWGGWSLKPLAVEFWQGRPNRFHDRVLFRLVDGSWSKARLAP